MKADHRPDSLRIPRRNRHKDKVQVQHRTERSHTLFPHQMHQLQIIQRRRQGSSQIVNHLRRPVAHGKHELTKRRFRSGEMNQHALPEKQKKRHQTRHELPRHRSRRSPGNPQVQHAHQHHIQHDIQHAAAHRQTQRQIGPVRRHQIRMTEKLHRHEDTAGNHDFAVIHAVRKQHIVRPQHVIQRLIHGQKHRRQHRRQRQRHHGRQAHKPVGIPAPALAQHPPDDRIASRSQHHTGCHIEIQQRKNDIDGRQPQTPDEIRHHNPVHHRIHGREHHQHHRRQREGKHGLRPHRFFINRQFFQNNTPF